MKGRKDKWTDEEHSILEKIVLEHIQMGLTKTAAFKKAASVLGRTQAACGHRWNHVLSKEKTTASSTPQLQLPAPKEYNAPSVEITLETVIQFLQGLKKTGVSGDQAEEKKRLLQEQHTLKEQHAALEKKYAQKKELYQELFQQYETFAKVLGESEELIGVHTTH